MDDDYESLIRDAVRYRWLKSDERDVTKALAPFIAMRAPHGAVSGFTGMYADSVVDAMMASEGTKE